MEPSPPTFKKLSFFYEILLKKKKLLCGLGFAGIDFMDKKLENNVKNSKKRPPPRLRLTP